MPRTDVVVSRTIQRTDQFQAFDLRATEIAAWNTLLSSLGPADWHRPTVCTAWDVADIVGHMIGQAEDLLYPWRFLVRNRRARRRYPDLQMLDGTGSPKPRSTAALTRTHFGPASHICGPVPIGGCSGFRTSCGV